MTRVLAIIPARGGSKRIPGKNLIPLNGKPLLAYSIEHALAATSVQRVVVSTDDLEISRVAEIHGAEVVLRPSDISIDTATSESALIHCLDHLLELEEYEPELVVFLQPTSPIRQPGDIQNAIERLMSKNADSLFSAVPVEGYIWRETPESLSPMNYDGVYRPRRQDLTEQIWEENGSIYIFKPWVLRKFNSRLGGNVVMYPMARLDSYQVDEKKDVMLMEKILKLQSADQPQRHGGTKKR
jgi:CMP-N,N'-diacetyllegionaminic acid synthase